MDDIERIIKKDVNTVLGKLKQNKNKSTYVYNLIDLILLDDLCNFFDIFDGQINNYDFISYEKYKNIEKILNDNFFKLFIKNKDFIKWAAVSIAESLNCYNFYPVEFKNMIKEKETVNITLDFLNHYNNGIYNLLKKVSKDNKIFMTDNFISYGFTYFSAAENFSPYIIIAQQYNIIDSITLAHEITHVYYMSRQNLNKNYYKINASNSCFNEIPTYTLELYFYNWLKENKICSSDNKTLYNLIFLDIYKESKYFFNYFKRNLNLSQDFETITSDDFKLKLYNFIGILFAFYFYSINDLEKIDSIFKKFYDSKEIPSLEEIISDYNLNYEDIINFKYGKKIAKKLYGYNGGTNE